jgi:hypothetical protein
MFDVTNVDMNGWNEYKPTRSVAWYEKHTTLSILLADGLLLQMAGEFMKCTVCDADFQVDTENCWINVREIDYGSTVDDKNYCSYRCLKEWYGL